MAAPKFPHVWPISFRIQPLVTDEGYHRSQLLEGGNPLRVIPLVACFSGMRKACE